MNYKLKEIYAVLEIKNYSLSFMVALYYNSRISVLYKKNIHKNYAINGVITNEKQVAKEISALVKDANRQLGLNIKRVAVSVPSDYLKIKQVNKILDLQQDRIVTAKDIDQLIKMSYDVSSLDDETVFFVRPYRYALNEQRAFSTPPINLPAYNVSLKAITYITKKAMINSINLTLKYAKLEMMGILPEAFALAWNIASPKDLKHGIIIVDWDYEAVKISVFAKETLCEQHVINGGVRKIIARLRNKLGCDNKVAVKYFNKIINLNTNIDDNMIIYSKYHQQMKKYLRLTHAQLKKMLLEMVWEELSVLDEKILPILEKYNYTVVFTGEIMDLSSISQVLYSYNPRFKTYLPDTIGAREAWCVNLLGNAYYQHLTNKITNQNVQSIDENLVVFLDSYEEKVQSTPSQTQPSPPNWQPNYNFNHVHK